MLLGVEKGRECLGLERVKPVVKQLGSAVSKFADAGEDSGLSVSG